MSRANVFSRHTASGFKVHWELTLEPDSESEKLQLAAVTSLLGWLLEHGYEPDSMGGSSAPAEPAPLCEECKEPRVYKEGKSKKGGTWRAWFCPDKNSGHAPMWVEEKDEWKN